MSLDYVRDVWKLNMELAKTAHMDVNLHFFKNCKCSRSYKKRNWPPRRCLFPIFWGMWFAECIVWPPQVECFEIISNNGS